MSIIALPGHMVKLFSELLTSACRSDIGSERRDREGGGLGTPKVVVVVVVE